MKLESKKLIDFYLGGFLLLLLKPFTILLGAILVRDHSLEPRGDIYVIKLQGGGSLVMASPALLSVKRKYPQLKLVLVTTIGLRQFAESLAIFDEVLLIDDRSLVQMVCSAAKVFWRSLGADTYIDLEVYSRLTGFVSLVSFARNRIGFFLEATFWRQGLYTHLLFFNRFTRVAFFYEQIAHMLGTEALGRLETAKHIKGVLEECPLERRGCLAIGHGCSDLAPDRKLPLPGWIHFLRSYLEHNSIEAVVFLGSSAEREEAQQIIDELRGLSDRLKLSNACGELSLSGSLSVIASARAFMGIDSALLHYARLLGISSTSFWGPVNPTQMLTPWDDVIDQIHYHQLPCSPCVHVAERAPCKGANWCMRAVYDDRFREQLPDMIREHSPWRISL